MTKEIVEKDQSAVIATAREIGGRVRFAYSGRYMYGRECMGIVHDDVNETIEAGARHGLRAARADNMGLSFIIYWPNVPAMVDMEDE